MIEIRSESVVTPALGAQIDSFLGTRRSSEHEAFTTMKTEFMSLWDGITTDDSAR